MNEKIQAILLKIVRELKRLKWTVSPDWEITLKSEQHVPMYKAVSVQGSIDEDEWTDSIDTHIDIKLVSNDEITYIPEYTIRAEIFIEGAGTEDVIHQTDVDVAFTEQDVQDGTKSSSAARKIDRNVENHIEEEYRSYVDSNAQDILLHKPQGSEEPHL